jgi:PAS domain S-box-containing protein
MSLVESLFGDGALSPHGVCLLWEPALIWLHVLSDGVIALSYFSIPIALGYLVARRTDLTFGWMIWLFGSFILACGTTHLFGIWTIWHPNYGAEGVVKAATATVSVFTAMALWPLLPKLLALPSHHQLVSLVGELSRETQERARAVDSLRESENRYRLIVDGVSDYAIYMLDPQGIITNWNAGAERMKGYRADEVVGRHFSMFFTEADRARGEPERVLATARRERKYEAELEQLRKDGTRFWGDLTADPLWGPDGTLIGFCEITRDITQQRAAAKALEETRSALAQAQKMQAVGHLTGGVAHDFNNLLTAVTGSLSLVLGGHVPFNETARPTLEAAMRAAQHGAALTHSLLAFARQQTLAPEVADINRLVAGMSGILRRTLGEPIDMETVLAEDLWRTFIDSHWLESAILNLAINGRDAMPNGGKLTIETANIQLDAAYAARNIEVAAGDYVLVAVTDSGTGMSAETLAQAFEPFFTTKAQGKGSGLGLSQVYGFVKQSGGDIKVYSELGVGTTVKLYLPRHLGSEPVETRSTAAAPLEKGAGQTVLVVEDSAEVRMFLIATLQVHGYRALEAENGEVGLALIEQHPEIALMVSDIVLPGIDGPALVERARQLRPTLKVLFMTGYAPNAAMRQGILEAGIELLSKPFTVETVLHRVNEMLLVSAPTAGS